MLLDVTKPEIVDDVFSQIDAKYGKLDFAIHSMAFAKRDDLHGRVVDTSADGFALAMDVSTHSFVRLARKAEPLLEKAGGYKVPPSQTPWQEIQRSMVAQFDEGMVLKPAVEFKDVAHVSPVPRDNH